MFSSNWLRTILNVYIYFQEIEIPGQYDGLSCIPDPSKHVKISSFDPKILVLRSLRKPKRISILGTDGNEYPFLVKVSLFL
jgi:DNA-dependent protein kinase catalytic subunit